MWIRTCIQKWQLLEVPIKAFYNWPTSHKMLELLWSLSRDGPQQNDEDNWKWDLLPQKAEKRNRDWKGNNRGLRSSKASKWRDALGIRLVQWTHYLHQCESVPSCSHWCTFCRSSLFYSQKSCKNLLPEKIESGSKLRLDSCYNLINSNIIFLSINF